MTREQEHSVSHIVDFYNRYPGETVRYSTLVQIGSGSKPGTVIIQLPQKVTLSGFYCADPALNGSCRVLDTPNGTQLSWFLPENLPSGSRLEIITEGIVQTTDFDQSLQSSAVLLSEESSEIDSDYVSIFVKLQGSYLNYLPEIYRQDDLMGRFLMLFESFWKPIDTQIRQISCYFDPDLTPEKMLPWLASWVGAYWDETLPDQRKRALLRKAVQLYQRRGTKGALKSMLDIYTNSEVHINEHPANNFQIGAKAQLGQRIALGMQNYPHTFTVSVQIDPSDFILPPEIEVGKLETKIRQNLDTIIEAQKPAHTAHKLNLTVRNSKTTHKQFQLESRKDLP